MCIDHEFINYYKYIETLTLNKEIINLERICKFLRLQQQSIAVVFYVFYIIKLKLKIEPDDIVVQCASIMLGCKMENIHRPYEKIIKFSFLLNNIEYENDLKDYYLDCIVKTEIEICEVLDFNFEFPEFYNEIKNIYEKIKSNVNSLDLVTIIMNDIITKPVSIVFEIEEIVLSCFFIDYLYKLDENEELLTNEILVNKFLTTINKTNVNVDAIIFIASEICRIYEV